MKSGRLLFLSVVVLLAAAGASLLVPYRGFSSEVMVDIPRGTGSRGVARLLAEAGVIRYRWQFLAVRAVRLRAKLLAGEYVFRREASPWGIFERMVRGDVFYYQLTVPEGNNIFEIAESLNGLGTIGKASFLEAARDVSPIRDLAPEAKTLEGFLFPDTYRITRHTTAADLCLQMTERFRVAWRELGAGKPVLNTVILASLVEKETAIPAERSLVASVFTNRLRAGIPLGCDPTAIYAALLEGRYRGVIYRSDLESDHPYNTYKYAGLPPGPIANAGLDALRAALNPAETRYLYFVAKADGSGTHIFSEGLDAHQRAVANYRRVNHKNNQKGNPAPVPGGKPARKAR